MGGMRTGAMTSGQVAGGLPFAVNDTTPVNLSALTNDEQFEAGITCNGVKSTLAAGFQSCAPSQYTLLAEFGFTVAGHGVTTTTIRRAQSHTSRNLFDVDSGWAAETSFTRSGSRRM